MPDKNGKLTDNDFEVLAEWLRAHPHGGMACLTCGNRPLALHDQLVAMPPTDGKSPHQTTGSVIISILLTCDVCGSNHSLNARTVFGEW